jgi:ribosomal protein S19
MGWLKDLYDKSHKRRVENHNKRVEETARQLYQITEYHHQLWFTYNGSLFAPCSVVVGNNSGEFSSTECVALLNTIRELYVQRHKM